MAASTQQKVDFLLKKIGYTASKTGLAEDSSLSGTKKAPFAEAVPSPLVIANASVWAESNLIPATPPGTDSAQVKVYLSGTSGHRMTVDSTVSGNRSYIAYSTYNDNTSAILGDWIDTQFGSSYIVKVYKGDPNAGGTALSAAGSGSSDGWFFDYSSGILNFNDTNVPTGVTDTNIYIVAYRYIGKKGVITAGAATSVTTLDVSGISTFSGGVTIGGGATVTSNLTVTGGQTTVVNLNVTGVTTFVNSIYDEGNLDVDGKTDLDDLSVSGVSTFSALVDADAGIDVTGHSELDNVNVSGVITAAQFSSDTTTIGQDIATRNLSVSTGSTFTGAIDANGGVDISGGSGLNVTGHTEVDYVNVSAAATIAGAVDINGGLDVSGGEATLSSAVVSDLTSGRLTYAGTSGALQDSGNLTFVADKLGVTGGIEVSAGATFAGAIDANGALDVDGQTELDDVNVSGASTFAGAVNANAGVVASTLKVSDLTDNRLVLSGTSGELEDTSKITFDGTTLAIVGDATFTGNVSVAGTLTSEDKTELDVIGIVTARSGVRVNSGGLVVSSGVNTFTDAIDANGGLDVSGGSGLVASTVKVSDLTSGRVVVAGTSGELEDASTFTVSGGTVSATAFSATNLTGTLQTAAQANITSVGTLTGLDVGGHSELDYVNVSAAATIAGAIDGNGGANFSGGETVISSATVSDLTEGRVTFAGVSGALQDSGNLTFDGTTLTAANFDGGGIGGISTTGSSNFNIIVIDSGLNVVSGVSTFQGNIDANGDIAIAGNAGIGSVDVTGILTAASLVAGGSGGVTVGANNDLNAATFRVSGIATFNGAIDANGALDVDGHTELDNVNVSGVSTFNDNVHLLDSDKLLIGGSAGTHDGLEIYHNSSNSFISDTGTGYLVVQGSRFEVTNAAGSEALINAVQDTGVTLYDGANTARLATNGYGVVVTGIATATTFSGAFEGSSVTASGDITANGNIIGDSATNISGMNNISATSINGTLADAAQTNITSLGSLTGLVVGGWSDLDDVYVSGVTTFFSDVVVADTIRHDGDDNTKIRFNGGDTLTIETNSAERLRVVKGGGVGIGTTNPSAAVTSANTAVLAAGIVTAYQLYGDGSNLSGVGFEPTTGDSGTGNLYAGTEAGNASDTDTYCNVAIGYRAGKTLNAGDFNVFLGTNAGCHADAGLNNISIGCNAAKTLTSGSDNIALGQAAMGTGVVTGNCNIALGRQAGQNLSDGQYNIFFGKYAGNGNTGGDCNIMIGCNAGKGITTADENISIGGLGLQNAAGNQNVQIGRYGQHYMCGACNISIGQNTMQGTTTAADNIGHTNVAIGRDAMFYQKTGCYNIGLGYQALYGASAGTTGNYNHAYGYQAGKSLTSGNSNLLLGTQTGMNLITGSGNAYLGNSAGRCQCNGSFNVALGYFALQGSTTVSDNTGACNIAIGKCAGATITSGATNIMIGCDTGRLTTSGSNNILLGTNAGDAVTTADNIIAIGNNALSAEDTAGSGSIAIGCGALLQQNATTGTYHNIAIGWHSGCSLVDATENVFVGYMAGRGVTGQKNVTLGGMTLTASTSGTCNTAIGQDAMRQNTGSQNAVVGSLAMWGAGDASWNAFLGQYAGYNITDGDKNTFLGRGAGNTVTTGCCNVLIGYEVDAVAASDKTFKIGISADTWISGDSSFNLSLAKGSVLVTQAAAGVGATIGPGDAGVTTYFGDGSNLTGVTAGFEADADLNLMSANTCSGCSLDGSSGCFNIFLGSCSGKVVADGEDNVFLGRKAGWYTTSGSNNIALGRNAGANVTTTDKNFFGGYYAGDRVRGSFNIILGAEAGRGSNTAADNTGSHNVVIGGWAGLKQSSAGSGVLVGAYAGCELTTGIGNVLLGNSSGTQLTDGAYNTFLGLESGRCMQSASNNIAIGYAALKGSSTPGNNTGDENIAIGRQAGLLITEGCHNFFGGYQSGAEVTSADNNVFLGQSSGANITTANSNVFLGESTGKCIQTGAHNLAMGSAALMGSSTPGNNTGSCNIGIGKGAGACMTTAGSNVLIGCKAGNQITEGTGNVALGPLALGSGLTTGVCNIAIGLAAAACQSTGSDNIAIGQAALTGSSTPGNNTGSDNIAIGKGSGLSVTSGTHNILIGGGGYTGCSITTGGENIAIGYYAGKTISTCSGNIFLGTRAGENTNGSNNFFGGYSAGRCNTSGKYNIYFGVSAGKCTSTGDNNIAIGQDAGHCNSSDYLIAIGVNAGKENEGTENIFIGRCAGMSNDDGTYNTFLGSAAGNTNTSGSCNIAVGYDVELPSTTADKQMAVGVSTNRWITGYTDFSIGGVFKNYAETYSAMGNTGTTPTIDLADGNVFSATLNGNATFTFTMGLNLPQTATSFTLILTNDSTPSRTISWPASVKWPNNSVPSRTTAASKTDIWSFMTPDGGATWYGNIALYNFT